MKLVVDMSPETFIAVKNLVAMNVGRSSYKTIIEDVFNSLKNATPVPDNVPILTVTEWADRCRECGAKNFIRIPDNATNGDVIKTMFPYAYIEEAFNGDIVFIDDYCQVTHCKEWWDAPYKKGGTE